MLGHPRYQHFPWQSDYSAQANSFCPYAMCVAQPSYSSKSLTTDSLGFRIQYDSFGKRIDLKTARSAYTTCTLLLGNSTLFGVSLTSDDKTLGHSLVTEQPPCISLAVRGATMQQELALFQTYKHLLPRPSRIVLLTGVCDVSLATQPEDLWSEEVGGMHSIDTFFKQYSQRVDALSGHSAKAKKEFIDWAEDHYLRSRWLQRIFERRSTKIASPLIPDHAGFMKSLDKIFPLMENVLETWGWIRQAGDIDIQVVLQPVLGWTSKSLSSIEHDCVKADIQRVPAIPVYANHDVYTKTRAFLQYATQKHQLGFIDSNSYFDGLGSKETLFSDICHLTDVGTERLAEYLIHNLPDKR